MKRLLFVLLSFVIILNSNLFSQQYPEVCPDIPINIAARPTSTLTQKGGLYKPASNAPGQYLRVLIVFAEFSGDNRTFGDWTYGQLPTYSDKIVDSVTAAHYRSFTLSDYWKTMSFGNYDIIGDVYPNVVTLRSEDWYRTNGKWFQDANINVLDSINGKVDFKKYDNWGYNTGTNSFIFNARNGDGYLDLMYIIYRTPKDTLNWFNYGYGNFGGIAILGNNFTFTTHDGTIIDGNYIWQKASGITVRKGAGIFLPSFIGLLSHELGHYLYGGGHTTIGGIMTDNGASGTFALSGWERERLGYSAYTPASQDNFTITLQDFVTTGQILKIPVPNSADKYFLVENHQRLSKFDQIMRGGSLQGAFDTTTTLGKGIYIWLIKSGDSYPPSVDVKTANGNWNWVYDGAYFAGPGWGETGYLPQTKREIINRNGWGKSDRNPRHIYITNPTFGSPRWWEKWVELNTVTEEYELTRNVMGLETHAFNFNYNELFTPWSNPSTYVDGVTNISMQLFSTSGSNVTLKVFNTNSSSLNLPPSKPFLGAFNAGDGPIYYGWAYLAWGADYWDGQPIESDVNWSELQRKINTNGAWQTVYSGPNRHWSDNSIIYDPENGNIPVFFRVRLRDSQNLWSLWSDLFDTRAFFNQEGNYGLEKNQSNQNLIPTKNVLLANYPNPFNPTTQINYSIKDAGLVQLKVYDILGKEVENLVNENKEAGNYSVDFDASELPSGVYIYQLQSNSFISSKKMVLIK